MLIHVFWLLLSFVFQARLALLAPYIHTVHVYHTSTVHPTVYSVIQSVAGYRVTDMMYVLQISWKYSRHGSFFFSQSVCAIGALFFYIRLSQPLSSPNAPLIRFRKRRKRPPKMRRGTNHSQTAKRAQTGLFLLRDLLADNRVCMYGYMSAQLQLARLRVANVNHGDSKHRRFATHFKNMTKSSIGLVVDP